MAEGMLMELETRNCWTLAEAIGDQGPHRLQHFLARAVWDEQAVLDAAARWAIGHLDDGGGILIADETGDAKSSTDAAGAAHQYSGSLGGIGLCQVAVHLSFATARGHALIDRRLYLPGQWVADDERRELAGVPDGQAFATKPELAAAMLERAVVAGVPAAFFVADEVYGSRDLRRRCRELGLGYAVAVRSNHRLAAPAGPRTAKAASAVLPKGAWQRMRTGSGQKGVRDWAWLHVDADDIPAGQDDTGVPVLLMRRHRYTGTLSFYRCWTAEPVPLARLVALVCRRWRVEEDFQAAKGTVGLDEGQVTCWRSWHRWSVVAMVVYAYLAVCAALERADQAVQKEAEELTLVPISCRELLRLLRVPVLPPVCRDLAHVRWWSRWRRRHQHRARTCHRRWNAYADTVA